MVTTRDGGFIAVYFATDADSVHIYAVQSCNGFMGWPDKAMGKLLFIILINIY